MIKIVLKFLCTNRNDRDNYDEVPFNTRNVPTKQRRKQISENINYRKRSGAAVAHCIVNKFNFLVESTVKCMEPGSTEQGSRTYCLHYLLHFRPV